jgi:hypothetical protein
VICTIANGGAVWVGESQFEIEFAVFVDDFGELVIEVEFKSKFFLIKYFSYKRLVGKKRDLVQLAVDYLFWLFFGVSPLTGDFVIHLLFCFSESVFHFLQHLHKESTTLIAQLMLLLLE